MSLLEDAIDFSEDPFIIFEMVLLPQNRLDDIGEGEGCWKQKPLTRGGIKKTLDK